MQAFIEQDCTIVHNGQSFTSGGAVITDNRIVAYLGRNRTVTDWHGNVIGTYKIVSTWKTPDSFVSSEMHAVYATVDGKLFKGRSAGESMVFFGKLAKVTR